MYFKVARVQDGIMLKKLRNQKELVEFLAQSFRGHKNQKSNIFNC